MLSRFIAFGWRMGAYFVLMWLGCAGNVGFFGHPFHAPTWVLAAEGIAFFLLITACENAHDSAQREHDDRLELQKHMMTLQNQADRLTAEAADEQRTPST